MSSKLSQLLAYYEAERNRLVVLVADCVAESEHKLAHHHAKALRLVDEGFKPFVIWPTPCTTRSRAACATSGP